jgi:hypothetical protein
MQEHETEHTMPQPRALPYRAMSMAVTRRKASPGLKATATHGAQAMVILQSVLPGGG